MLLQTTSNIQSRMLLDYITLNFRSTFKLAPFFMLAKSTRGYVCVYLLNSFSFLFFWILCPLILFSINLVDECRECHLRRCITFDYWLAGCLQTQAFHLYTISWIKSRPLLCRNLKYQIFWIANSTSSCHNLKMNQLCLGDYVLNISSCCSVEQFNSNF